MRKNIVRLNESKLKSIIREAVVSILSEAYEDVICPKLAAIQNRFGKIKQINLPDGVFIGDIHNEDVKKITSDPGDAPYSVALEGGMYAAIFMALAWFFAFFFLARDFCNLIYNVEPVSMFYKFKNF